MTSYLFTGGRVLDPERAGLIDGLHVLVEDGTIREVSDRPIRSNAETVDLGGKTLMPGLIDCHVHVNAGLVDIAANAMLPSSLAALRAAKIMEAMLGRGFTTVRDLGGADLGLVLAVEEGLIAGPRLVICGKALSPTGGHGDFRRRADDRAGDFSQRAGSMSRLVDGVDAIRRAAREEIKAGARFIKIMANGGVASPNDPIDALGFSLDEVKAAVEEADNAGLHVAAHLYTDRAIARAVDCGVHSLEHCNLIRPETAKRAAEAGCIAVPTLVAYEALALEGGALGLSPEIGGEDRDGAAGRDGIAFDHARGGPADGLRQRPARRADAPPFERVRNSRPRPAAGRDHRLGDDRRGEALPDGGEDRHHRPRSPRRPHRRRRRSLRRHRAPRP